MLAIRGKAIVLLAGTVVLGCDTAPRADLLTPVITQRDEGTLTPSAVSLWAAQVEDSTGPDAAYAMFVPTNWDESGRRLMLFVHGYVDPDSAVTLPNIAALRDAVGAKGFAVAYSSFSENGWAVKDGEQRSHQLRGLFASRFGEPARTYIYGRSMGGLIAVMMAEKYPEQYAGVFSECGVIGGAPIRFRYLFDVRQLFDYFYPDQLPGNVLGVPLHWRLGKADADRIDLAMATDMSGALAIAKIDQTPVQFQPGNMKELRAAIIDQLTRHAREVNDIMARGHGKPPIGSSVYTDTINADGTFLLDPGLLASVNSSTVHFDAEPDAAKFAAHYYDPSGDLRIPVMTLTTKRDPALPSPLSEVLYQSRVDAAGSDMLLRRPALDRYGHCAFLPAERANAFLDFVTWADTKAPATP